ncbi:MAG: TonB-dependent receptor plug domain-containing protein [Candidatus Krumholzibacteriota bacterium]|nr:TonB-dependent receptor plug domain-containing protein [Candidatus Krumholzibacteriota bacterium]
MATRSMSRTGGFLILFLIALIVAPQGAGAARRGRLVGRVMDVNTSQPLGKALITIQGTTISTLTDANGRFFFDLDPGKYSITIHMDEYFATCYQDIEVEGGQVTTYKCEMVPGDPRQNIFFSMGGINVIEKRELLPENIETTHQISSAEIEHQLSTNLGDILDIIPGVERTKNPGLSEKSQVILRGSSGTGGDASANQAALFGTKIIIDDITLSNNANLQTGPGTASGTVSSTAGSAVDLRTIPADNIESVEVITGVPSVEYGDLTTGLVKVKTKMGRQPHRLKIKSNPDTKEGNLSGGLVWRGTGISYNANYAYSERNIRREGDEYARYNGQFTIRNKFMDDRLSLLNKFYYTGVDDEEDYKSDDPLSVVRKNNDKTYIYGQTIDFAVSDDMRLEWRANIKYTKRDSYQQSLTGADTRVLTDAMESGTNEAILQVGSYLYRIWTRGEEWNVNTKLNVRYDLGLLGLDHGLLFGGEYTFDDNRGEGKIFNPLEPPYGNLGYRPRSFDDVPALHTANLYFEDEITGFWRMQPYSINLGLRYEMYTPYKLHLDGLFNDKGIVESRNGTYLNPRIRAKYSLGDNTQIRLGWGKSSKMPSMTMISQGPEYIDIIEENVSPPDSTPLISTYVLNWDDLTRELKGYQSTKSEASLDQKIGSVGLTFTGFYDRSDDILRSVTTPLTLYRYRYENWPDPDSAVPIDTLYTTPDKLDYYANVGWRRSYGIEFLLTTRRIERISTAFRMSATYSKTRTGADGVYMSSPRTNTALGQVIYPFYRYTESWHRRMVVNYSADWFVKRLGMWVTFFVQQTLFSAYQSYDDPYAYSVAYFDPVTGRNVTLSPEDSDALNLTREYDAYDLAVKKQPNDRFLFNINVTKSIGRGSELSLFVTNVLDDPAYYRDDLGYWRTRNPDIFYGVEFSMILDNLWSRIDTKDGGS